MTVLASGQISFWEGGSLWVFDVPPGPDTPNRNDLHAHHAFQVTFALDGQFKLHLEDRILGGPLAVVAPNVNHAFEAQGFVALLFVEPEGRAGRALRTSLAGAPGRELEPLPDAAEAIARAFRDAPDTRLALRATGEALIGQIAGRAHIPEPDRRVRQMIRWAGANLDAQPGINEAAKQVGLSAGRASHLFVEQTGLPFRTYVLWLRLVRATDAYARGESLTAAAQEAGFADSAHLSRTFRRMFGLSAAALELS